MIIDHARLSSYVKVDSICSISSINEAANDLRFFNWLLWAATPPVSKNPENMLC
jgi:hypothetical protein